MAESDDAGDVLKLTTLIERPTISIDGKRYEIVSPDELSVIDHQRFSAWGRRIDKLTAKDELSDEEESELHDALHELSDKIMIGVPQRLRKKLSDSQRLQVAEGFMMLSLPQRLRRAAAAAKSIGESSRRGSKDSSAATRRGGSTKPPSPSSEPTPQ